ncbi:hypothetical protein RCL1_005089 [Eukaryota sp. TZLM3-RCL]
MDCCVCFEPFSTNENIPVIICDNNHSVCDTCVGDLQNCPMCRSSCCDNPRPNVAMISLLEVIENGTLCQQIPFSDVSLEVDNVTSRIWTLQKFTLYSASWKNAPVNIKMLIGGNQAEIQSLEQEAFHTMRNFQPFHHRVYGFCRFPSHKVGVVMDPIIPLNFSSCFNSERLLQAIDIVRIFQAIDQSEGYDPIITHHSFVNDKGSVKYWCFPTNCLSNEEINRFKAPIVRGHAIPSSSSRCFNLGMLLCDFLCRSSIPSRSLSANRPSFSIETPPALKSLIENCCNDTPSNRPSFSNILNILGELYQSITPQPHSPDEPPRAEVPQLSARPSTQQTVRTANERLVKKFTKNGGVVEFLQSFSGSAIHITGDDHRTVMKAAARGKVNSWAAINFNPEATVQFNRIPSKTPNYSAFVGLDHIKTCQQGIASFKGLHVHKEGTDFIDCGTITRKVAPVITDTDGVCITRVGRMFQITIPSLGWTKRMIVPFDYDVGIRIENRRETWCITSI